MRFFEFLRGQRSDKKKEASDSDRNYEYWKNSFHCRFTLNGVRYRVDTENTADLEQRKLLELPTGEMYLVEWSKTSIPPNITQISRIPAGMNVSQLRSIVVENDTETDAYDHLRFRVD
ncbi:hypothetical protein KBD71_01045 [Candidatus Woesebacteria bacterium]|nr:hypothetical protein [Candidatus Woesebacteria bacterium]